MQDNDEIKLITKLSDGRGARVANRFLEDVFKSYMNVFQRTKPVLTAFRGSFNERMLYGAMTESITMAIQDGVDQGSCLVTECPVPRVREDRDGTGRVDYVVRHKGWVYLVELKAIRLSPDKPDVSADRFNKALINSLEQVDKISVNNAEWLRQLHENVHDIKGLIKASVVIVNYARSYSEKSSEALDQDMTEACEETKDNLERRHANLTEEAREIAAQKETKIFSTCAYDVFNGYSGNNRNNTKKVLTHGFGMIAAVEIIDIQDSLCI